MTAMADALERAGFNQFDHQLTTIFVNYFKAGGTDEHLLDLIGDAKRKLGMPGEGHLARAKIGQKPIADVGQSLEGAEAIQEMPDGQIWSASAPSPDRDGAGQGKYASPSHIAKARPVASEPTSQQRSIGARNATKVAVTIMDTLKINGRAVGDFTVGEARRMGRNKSREGYILLAATRCVANPNGSDKIRDVVKVKEMQRIIQQAAEFADAA